MSTLSPVPMPKKTDQRRLIITAVVVVLGFTLLRGCFFHENKYEHIARDLTAALQSNDLPAVEKLQNAETATHINHGVVGRWADRFTPLGKIVSVKEVTPKDAPARSHAFEVTFDKGVVHEDIGVDPEDKVVHFTATQAAKK
jgi:hypothetical protein